MWLNTTIKLLSNTKGYYLNDADISFISYILGSGTEKVTKAQILKELEVYTTAHNIPTYK